MLIPPAWVLRAFRAGRRPLARANWAWHAADHLVIIPLGPGFVKSTASASPGDCATRRQPR